MDYYSMADDALVKHLGQTLQQQRLKQNLTQKQLAERAGIDRTTISYFENGRPSSTLTFIQLLRGLQLLETLEQLEVREEISPLALLKQQEKQRRRASGSGAKPDKPDTKW